MNRFPRTFVTLVLIAVLLVAVAPAVQARPLAKPRISVQPVSGDWLGTAILWLSRLFQAELKASGGEVGTKPPIPLPLGGPFNGSCIDPNGGLCACGGGGGGM